MKYLSQQSPFVITLVNPSNGLQLLLTELDFMTASWRRAIEQLNSEETAWLHYCYGCKPNYKNDVTICQWLWLDFLIAHSRAGFKDESLNKNHAEINLLRNTAS